MPWYYASREAKPAGPVTMEDLHALRAQGVILPETYVIEYTGQPVAGMVWRKYGELFSLAPGVEPTSAPLVTPAPSATASHPLFPSAAPAGMPPPVAMPTSTYASPYHISKPTNSWCAWGFGLGLAGFFFSFVCGLGIFLALPSLLLCGVGLAQVNRNREQSGQGLAIAGLTLAVLSLLVCLIYAVCLTIPFIRAHEQTATEESSNDSD